MHPVAQTRSLGVASASSVSYFPASPLVDSVGSSSEIHPEPIHISPAPTHAPVQAAVSSHLADCSPSQLAPVAPPLPLCSLLHAVITLQLEYCFWNATLLPRRLYQFPSHLLQGPTQPLPSPAVSQTPTSCQCPGSLHASPPAFLTALGARQACPGSLLCFLRVSRSPLTAVFTINQHPAPPLAILSLIPYPALFSFIAFSPCGMWFISLLCISTLQNSSSLKAETLFGSLLYLQCLEQRLARAECPAISVSECALCSVLSQQRWGGWGTERQRKLSSLPEARSR